MTKYIANENGDWWEVVEGASLYLIDTEWENIANKMKEENSTPNDDKFERFIWRYGTEVNIDMSRWVKV
jgi:DNA-binding transcriptional regulator/RsmH inhibitor MraZ